MTTPRLLLRVVTAAQAVARDAEAIAAGTPSSVLMASAGTGTAREILCRFGPLHHGRVLVLCGPGNNGGDGWVVARALVADGVDVDVCEAMPARSDDAVDARAHARREAGARLRECTLDDARLRTYAVVVDALLGTGATGAPRGAITHALEVLALQRAAAARVVAVDLPTGLDATSGNADHAVPADVTVTYGTVKRGQLVSRGVCGTLVVLDIGLGRHAALSDDAPLLADEPWVAAQVPVIHADAHKGTRRKIVILGGADGMSGAVILAARSALRSGAGMVKVLVHPASLDAVRAAEPAVLTAPWPESDADVDRELSSWADMAALGPGLGNTPHARGVVERLLTRWRGPVVLDADALNVFAGALDQLTQLLDGRQAVLTPHPAEFARLTGTTVAEVLAHRFEVGCHAAARVRAAILLKGTPTVVFAPDGTARMVSASGTPVLATGGSGDMLTGIVATLLAQMDDVVNAAACAAWVHGRAAELAQCGRARIADALTPRRDARGLTLDDVLAALPDAWRLRSTPPAVPLLVELPAVEQRT